MAMNKDFGAFELKEKIGMGGMASVFLAEQKALQRKVVLKILHTHLADDEKLVQRFEREARAAAMMRHENIIQVIDMGRHEDVAFIAMEFVEGMDLQKWLQAHGTPPLEMALLMIRDVCRGLEHAHGNRIIHRDVKPANVMLTPDGMIKLMDFGLARGGSETSTQMTMVGSVLGTPAYMSPEQATGEVVDARSDVFSTGVVAYELLGGTRPFAGDSYSTVLRSILTVEPPEVTTFNPLVPDEVARIVRGMLQKDAGKRTQTITQVLGDLEDVIEHLGLHRGKDLLREYAMQPEAVVAMWHRRHLSRHLDQGLYFENMGLGKIDDALKEFRRVLHLDPDNAVAKDHLKKLERDRERLVKEGKAGDPNATVVMEPAAAAPPPPADTEATVVGAPPPLPGSAPPQEPAKTPASQGPIPVKRDPKPPKAPDGEAKRPAPAKPAPAAPAAPKAPAAKPAGGPAAKRGLPVPALAGIGAVLLVAAVALVVAMTRGPSSAPEESAQSAAVAPAPLPDSALSAAALPPAPPEDPAPAAADDPSPPTIDDARRALDEGRYAEALTLSRALLAGSLPGRQRRLGLEIVARALAGENRAGEAQSAFTDLMKRYPAYTPDPSLNSAERAAYDAAKAEADRIASTPAPPPIEAPAPIAAPAPTATTATIVVRVEPFGDFFVDDKRIDGNKKQFRTTVPPGTHKVTVKHPSLGNREWSITLAAGQTRELEYDFTSLAGSVTVTAEPTWGDIYMDGVRIGHTTPWTISPVPPGQHDITLVREGYVVEGGAQRINVKVRDELTLKFRLKKK